MYSMRTIFQILIEQMYDIKILSSGKLFALDLVNLSFR